MIASTRWFVVSHAPNATPMLHFALTLGFALAAAALLLLAV